LDNNPIIKYKSFKLKSIKLYYKCNCKFKITENSFKNIYYNWRRKSPLFTKFSIFTKTTTKNDQLYLRDYRYCIIYKNNGKKIFKHEHIIWCSNYFIKKLRDSEHWYIDGTCIYPKPFKQLICILYIDNKIYKRYPALYSLINNKYSEGYLELFKQIKSIITLENSKELKLSSYTIDFELGLKNALEVIFPNIRPVRCYYHYFMNIFKNAKNIN